MKLCVVTPTGGRRELLALCRQWVLHQVVQPDLWLILTDTGETDPGIELPPFARHVAFGRDEVEAITTFDNSNRSIALAAEEVPSDHATVIMEDDDYYPRDYVALQLAAISRGNHVVGDRLDHRYHVGTYQHIVVRKPIPNLGCMAFAPGVFAKLRAWLCDPHSSRDYWLDFQSHFGTGALRFSVKGAGYAMPGRKGKTHDPSNPSMAKWRTDSQPYATLRQWLGADAEGYIALAEEFRCKSVS